MGEILHTDKCSMCGLCCKLFLINLNEEEYLSGKYQTIFDDIQTFDDFATAEMVGANILRSNVDNSCIYLKSGRCSIHSRRPIVCRNFFCKSTEPEYKTMRDQINKARNEY